MLPAEKLAEILEALAAKPRNGSKLPELIASVVNEYASERAAALHEMVEKIRQAYREGDILTPSVMLLIKQLGAEFGLKDEDERILKLIEDELRKGEDHAGIPPDVWARVAQKIKTDYARAQKQPKKACRFPFLRRKDKIGRSKLKPAA